MHCGSDSVTVCFELKSMSTFFSTFSFFSFSFFLSSPQLLTLSTVNSAYVYCSWFHKLHFLAIFLLKMGSTTLFTHLKIILLQCFQFQFSISAKISSIQTDPEHYQIEPRKEYKILSPPREWDMIAIYGLKFKVARLNIRSIVSILSYLWRI